MKGDHVLPEPRHHLCASLPTDAAANDAICKEVCIANSPELRYRIAHEYSFRGRFTGKRGIGVLIFTDIGPVVFLAIFLAFLKGCKFWSAHNGLMSKIAIWIKKVMNDPGHESGHCRIFGLAWWRCICRFGLSIRCKGKRDKGN